MENSIINELLAKLPNLYEKDPKEFEKIRKQIFEQFINDLPEKSRKRARGIQFTIEAELNKYTDPVVRMNRMVELFWKQFADFHGVLHDPMSYIKDNSGKKAEVINFNKKATFRR